MAACHMVTVTLRELSLFQNKKFSTGDDTKKPGISMPGQRNETTSSQSPPPTGNDTAEVSNKYRSQIKE